MLTNLLGYASKGDTYIMGENALLPLYLHRLELRAWPRRRPWNLPKILSPWQPP